MINLDRWNEVFETLRRNKLRTTLTALGVFWGVFMLVVMLGFGRGLETGVMGTLGRWAKNALAVWPTGTAQAYHGHKPGRRIQMTHRDVELISNRVTGIRMVAPRIHGGWGSSNVVSYRDKSESFSVSGDVPEYLMLEPLAIVHGRFLNPNDLTEYRKVAVIGWTVKETLFPPEVNPVEQEIHINGVPYMVIGVYRSQASGEQADFLNGRILTPITTFARSRGMNDQINAVTVLLEDGVSSEAVEAQILALLKRAHDVHPQDPGGFDSFNREREFRRLQTLFTGIAGLSWFVGVLTLLAGAIGVSNILMISITERTKEIGIRKAIGATPGSILAQIVQEAMVLTGLSGGLGLVAGVGALAVANTIFNSLPQGQGPSFFAPPDLDLRVALMATVALTLAGGFAGIAPARTALAIKPIEALAHE